MPRSLTFKLIAAFLGVSVGAIALVAVLSWYAANTEFTRFVGQQAEEEFSSFVRDYYTANGTLDGIEEAIRTRVEAQQEGTPGPRFFPFGLAAADGTVINSNEGFHLGESVPVQTLALGSPIASNGQMIAIILPHPAPPPRNRAQDQFVERTLNTLLVSAGGAALLAILIGVVLARTITRPVQELTDAAQRMAKGELGQTVRVQSRDELGDLATAFNQMSADLKRADQVRRQMTADIAHELRNPLTVIGGYLDAMRNGDLQPTPKRLDAVYSEIQQLERIVEDLRTLSLADANALVLNRTTVAPRDVLQRVADRFAPQADSKKIRLAIAADAALPALYIDEARMTQVLDNLVSNALHHTPADGAITLGATARGGSVFLEIRDTGAGIAPQDLLHVFERFYRGDQARPTEEGSSGLGLAIAQALVNAHGGIITVASTRALENTRGQGTTFTIQLPEKDG